ncbi:MAG: sensor domain-containing diguanylate cyclase [Desulfovibrio sp.]|jgi:diguanylate cyclase (GGDEF)-like protein/PAS domain S-box-containing protein|nr:sensor domain-containing diguanylate cyclase [Desulfovibrio sp.]
MYSLLENFSLRAVLETFPNAVFLKNSDLRYVFINKAYEMMFGIKKEDIIGKTVLDLEYLPNDDRSFYQCEDLKMLKDAKIGHHIVKYTFSDGKVHICHYWISGFVQDNGVRGLLGVIVDVDQERKVIAMLQKKIHTVVLQKRQIEEESTIDFLTGLHTRKLFEDALFRYAAAGDRRFSCIMFDIDHFKAVNDTFGHPAGDTVLKEVAQVFKECSRTGDIVCRYGGEEFVLLLPGSGLGTAVSVAERMRERVAEKVGLPDGRCITVSAGCSEHAEGEYGSLVLQRADDALYAAKNSGRNRVCMLRAPASPQATL